MNHLQDVYFSNLNVASNFGGFFNAPVGHDWSWSGRPFVQNKFYFVTKGSCTIVIEGKEYLGKSGDWFFIPANAQHSYRNHNEKVFQKYWMHFDIYPNNGLFQILNLPYVVKVEKGGKAYKLFKQYAHLSGSDKLTDKITVKSILMQLVAEYISLAIPDNVSVKSISDTKIDNCLRFINNNIEKPLTVTELAAEAHMHPTHFIRFFKEKTGQTPAKYVKAKKMETAKRYLEDSDLYITEIMEKIGETDSASFSKQFKSCYSLSPRSYRKMYIKDQ
ncbi:MAG: helix-turn-helix domain-containing protein [Clostridia bacterium]|nr:helix-turn-helix domain-containing protein [Clostridia bacterium]